METGLQHSEHYDRPKRPNIDKILEDCRNRKMNSYALAEFLEDAIEKN